MTIYHTYIDDNVGFGSSTVLGIQTNGSSYGVGISSNIVCQNLNITGISTLGVTTTTNLTTQQLIVSGIATVGLGTTSAPPSNSQMSFELTSNTNLRIKVRGTDGVLRSGNITLI
jgi:hypothetical protein